jgi:type IV secretory pathway VirD2 relaxase
VGRIAAKGLADEFYDRGYIVVEGLDGRAHYVPLARSVDIADLPTDGIVEGVQPSSPVSPWCAIKRGTSTLGT